MDKLRLTDEEIIGVTGCAGISTNYRKIADAATAKVLSALSEGEKPPVLGDDAILAAWERSGTTNLFSYQEKGRPVAKAQRDHDVLWQAARDAKLATDKGLIDELENDLMRAGFSADEAQYNVAHLILPALAARDAKLAGVTDDEIRVMVSHEVYRAAMQIIHNDNDPKYQSECADKLGDTIVSKVTSILAARQQQEVAEAVKAERKRIEQNVIWNPETDDRLGLVTVRFKQEFWQALKGGA